MSPLASITTTTDRGRLAETVDAWRSQPFGGLPSYGERLSAFDALSAALMQRDRRVATVLPAAGAAFAAAFLRATNLQHLVSRELPNDEALDRFVRVDERKSVRVLPKGVACHWIAGNVPLLGLFSWALSALVGNRNVVRLSSRGEDVLSPVIELLAAVSPHGAALANNTLVVQFPRDDHESHRVMSAAADVRIAWGGREAVEAVMTLPARWDCETVVLGPRTSIAVIDPDLLGARTLTRLATDVAYFDQQACSSPQWIFVKRTGGGERFAQAVHDFSVAFAAQCRALARHPLDHGETYRIELDRARVLLEGGALHRDGETAWTVAVVKAPDLRLTCANRFVQLVPVASVDEVIAHIPSNVQTAVTLLDEQDGERFSELAARRGVCRFPRPGEGNNFETPWDGIPLVSRLTRWSVRTEAAQR